MVFRGFSSNRNEKKIQVKMNKPVYLGLSIQKISKTLMYEFWYYYIKPKYPQNANLPYMDSDSFMKMFMKTLQMMLKKDLIHEIMKLTDHCLQEKSDWINERCIRRKDYGRICIT